MISTEKPGSPEELIHFGAKGMRWGVRKEEKTSNRKSSKSETSKWSTKKRTRVENRAKGHEATARKAQVEIDKLKANPSTNHVGQINKTGKIRKLENERNKNLKAAKDLREGHLTDYQKNVAIGSGVAIGIIAAYGTYKFVDSGSYTQFKNRNIPLKKNELLARHMNASDIKRTVISPINEEYGSSPRAMMNCRRCTFGYEMRRRGFDVKATKTITASGQTPAGLVNATNPGRHIWSGPLGFLPTRAREAITGVVTDKKGPLNTLMSTSHGLGKENIDLSKATGEYAHNRKATAIWDAISKHPDGARGELGVEWVSKGAHSMAWENIDGRPHLFDTQTGTEYNVFSLGNELGPKIKRAAITRLDDIPLNENFLKKWVTNV